MVVQADQTPAAVDPATLAPLCDEAEFAQEVAELVAEEAPRLFAVVQEYGERADGRIAAWGMAFEDHAKVCAVDRPLHLSLRAPERAVRAFSHSPHITARLVWVNPAALTQPEADEPHSA
ncbi:MAG: hypothetical protein ACRDRU_05645 [Pseudonocardiaceae bacterium]